MMKQKYEKNLIGLCAKSQGVYPFKRVEILTDKNQTRLTVRYHKNGDIYWQDHHPMDYYDILVEMARAWCEK